MRPLLYIVLKQYPLVENSTEGPVDLEGNVYGNLEVAMVAARSVVRHEVVEMACVVCLEPGIGMNVVHTERKK